MARKDTRFTLRRTAGEVKRYRRYVKLIPIFLVLLVLVLVLSYIVAAMYTKYGAFTVMVNKLDNLEYALTLSESPEFTYQTSRLNADIDKEMTNISGDTLPDYLDNVDGEHNGKDYIAYTFYCKNAGTATVTYNYELYLVNAEQDLEKAVRIRLYVDGVATTYAYPRTDGVEGPEPGTTPFVGGMTVAKRDITDFKPGDMTKYTIVIWLEGDDPDCVDKVLGGTIKVDMSMTIVDSDRDED